MSENKNMQELNLDEMNKVSGGAIVKSRGKYYAACDPSYDSSLYSKGYRTKEAAEKIAEKNGWSKEEYTRAEYSKAMGRDTSIW